MSEEIRLIGIGDISPTEIQTYLNFLLADKEVGTFCLLDKQSKKQIVGYGTFYSKKETLFDKLDQLDKKGMEFTLHTTLNRTSLEGRKEKQIQAPRVLCVDLDTAVSVKAIRKIINKYNVGMVVESSVGKYHLYWKVSNTIRLEEWKKYQVSLAEIIATELKIKADYGIGQISKTMRVPGVSRITKQGEIYTPTVKYLQDRPLELKKEDIHTLFGSLDLLESAYNKAQSKLKVERENLRKIAKELRSGRPNNPHNRKKIDTSVSGRNNNLFTAVKYYIADSCTDTIPTLPSDEDIQAFAEDINASFTDPLEQEEMISVVASATHKGILAYNARKKKMKQMKERSLPSNPLHILEAEILEGVGSESVLKSIHKTNKQNPDKDPSRNHDGRNPNSPMAMQLAKYTPYSKYNYETMGLKINRFTETGVVERMVQRYSARILSVGGQIYAYNTSTKTWRPQQRKGRNPELSQMAVTCTLDFLYDPEFIPQLCISKGGEPSYTKMRQLQERYLSLRTISQAITATLGHYSITEATASQFDRVEHLIYCANGVVDMRRKSTDNARKVKASDYMLQKLDIDYVYSAVCPRWEQFLSEIFPDNTANMIRFIQRLFGYSISGSTKEQKLFCHVGDGSNGKSKLLHALNKISGGYSTYVMPEEVLKVRGEGKSIERFGAKLEGKRNAIVDDMDARAVWNEATVKLLTSQKIRAAAVYEVSREIENRTTLHLGLNETPVPEGNSYGIIRRLCFIPYNVRFSPNANKEDELNAMLEEEKEGILAWAIEGYRQYYSNGFDMAYPVDTKLAEEEYKEEHSFVDYKMLLNLFKVEVDSPQYAIKDLLVEINNILKNSGTPDSRLYSARKLTYELRQHFPSIKMEKKWCSSRANAFNYVNLTKVYADQDVDQEII